ncbi:hypothetical protein Tco_1282859 [Tanacetum coccineum]
MVALLFWYNEAIYVIGTGTRRHEQAYEDQGLTRVINVVNSVGNVQTLDNEPTSSSSPVTKDSSHVGTSVSTQRKRTHENVQEISLSAEDASSKRRRGPTTSVGNRRPRRSDDRLILGAGRLGGAVVGAIAWARLRWRLYKEPSSTTTRTTSYLDVRMQYKMVHHSSTAHCFKAPSWNYLALSEFTKENGDTDHKIGRIAMKVVSTAAVQVVGNPSLQISL